MTPGEVAAEIAAGGVVLDLRPPRPFAAAHLPGAINLQFNRADLAERAEMVLPPGLRYLVHAEPDPIAGAAVEILRGAGFEVAGSLAGGLRAWQAEGRPVETLPVIDVDILHRELDNYTVVDAREAFEYRHGHISGALPLPSGEAWEQAPALGGREHPLAVVCGDQVRSSLVASILLRHGRPAVLVFGGMADWLERGYPVEKTTRPQPA